MVDELRIYTLRPGAMARYMELAEKVAVPVRGDRFGVLLGFWAGEVGATNSVFNLWRHDDLETRRRLRSELEALPAWRERYLAEVRPLMLRQMVRFLDPVLPLAAPPAPVGLYEFRLLRSRAGEAGALARAIATSPDPGTLGIWTTSAGPINEVVQLLGHPDARARFARSLHGADGVLAREAARIEEVESSLVLAAPHSPLR
ncbi:NIPSNAP family protein [Falsiroseomonas sp.]|uniref:NIPSNAP family protein n=1 Tax=Falsiroseomonas sp. TaxID=2870721 RepID=UPI0035642670